MVRRRALLFTLLSTVGLACASSTATRAPTNATSAPVSEPPPAVPEPDRRWFSDADDSPLPITRSDEPLQIEVDCEGPIPVFAAGRQAEAGVCVRSERFTIVSLADDWTPAIFDVDPALGARGIPAYRDEYIALANEELERIEDPSARRRYLELLGIFPTVDVLIERLRDDARHECHAAIDDSPLRALVEAGDAAPSWPSTDVHVHSGRAAAAIETAQRHLICDRLLTAEAIEWGVADRQTHRALGLFQRKQMIVGTGHLDAPTARALAMDSREQDFRAVLRMLRERVVDATGVIADGSASHGWGTVLGRVLDPPQMRSTARQPPAPRGAPDRVSATTEAAAIALGLTNPETAAEALMTLPARVALQLPAPPRFDERDGDEVLWVEIHRGADPRDAPQRAPRPVLTLYALEEGDPVALVRWPTTIGGYEEEETPSGQVRTRFFESPLGRRVWRRLIAGPAWLPPHDTPDETFVRKTEDGWELETSITGPGYDSAYGLMMIIHELPNGEGRARRFYDEGIRTHGSVSYRSILGGTSHGCHRVYNHLAVRLGGHLLKHRRHERVGNEEVDYRHRVDHGGRAEVLEVSSRGYRYDFVEPVPVLVVDGVAPGPEGAPLRDEALR